jgi:surface polysaccharide O-acyltransferase-like enzyme
MSPATAVGETPTAATDRDLALDAYKGIAILAVILHHVSGFGLRQTVPGSDSYFLTVALNRFLLFCVPAFLFLTLFLLTRSLIRRPVSSVDFWRRRFPRILWPYLIWSLFYLLLNASLGVIRWDAFADPSRWFVWLAYGKASFHLYFLVIVLQIYVFLPDLTRAFQDSDALNAPREFRRVLALGAAALAFLGGAPFVPVTPRIVLRWIGWAALDLGIYLAVRALCAGIVRRAARNAASRSPAKASLSVAEETNPPDARIWLWLAFAFALQIAVYWIHRIAIRSPFPATLVLWYVMLTLTGVWAARNDAAFRRQWPRLKWPLGALSLAAFAIFLPAAMSFLGHRSEADPFYYASAYWAFTGLVPLYLLGACPGLVARLPRLGRLLAWIGSYSMELYLIHPALLSRAATLPVHGNAIELMLYIAALFVLLTAATLALAAGLRKTGLGVYLFGK